MEAITRSAGLEKDPCVARYRCCAISLNVGHQSDHAKRTMCIGPVPGLLLYLGHHTAIDSGVSPLSMVQNEGFTPTYRFSSFPGGNLLLV